MAEPARGDFGVNQPYINCQRFIVPAAGVNYHLPDIVVPEGMQLLLKAWPTNVGLIYITGSSANQNQINQSYPLMPNEPVGYRVKNAKAVYVAAVNAGDALAITVESASRY